MRRIRNIAVGVLGTAAVLSLTATPAVAGPYASGTVTSPSANTVLVKLNNLTESNRKCGFRLEGMAGYSTPSQVIAPKSTWTLMLVDVPSGNYSAKWECDAFAGGGIFVQVDGKESGTTRIGSSSVRPTSGATSPTVSSPGTVATPSADESPTYFGSLGS